MEKQETLQKKTKCKRKKAKRIFENDHENSETKLWRFHSVAPIGTQNVTTNRIACPEDMQ